MQHARVEAERVSAAARVARVAAPRAQVEPQTAQVEPQTAQVEPQAAQVEPQAAPAEPQAAQVEPQAAQVEPRPAQVEARSIRVALPRVRAEPPPARGAAPRVWAAVNRVRGPHDGGGRHHIRVPGEARQILAALPAAVRAERSEAAVRAEPPVRPAAARSGGGSGKRGGFRHRWQQRFRRHNQHGGQRRARSKGCGKSTARQDGKTQQTMQSSDGTTRYYLIYVPPGASESQYAAPDGLRPSRNEHEQLVGCLGSEWL